MNSLVCAPPPKNPRLQEIAAVPEEPALGQVFDQLLALHHEILDFERSMEAELDQLHQAHVFSARNLLHYVAFRRHDMRDLQDQLSALGLSSLGRSEACLRTALQRVLSVLGRLALKTPPRVRGEVAVALDEGKSLLARNTAALFGPDPPGKRVRIMVTMSTEAAHSYEHVRDLLSHGMDCMRINCAHDDAAAWKQMIDHLRRAEQELQKSCSVLMDLCGPKLRTGPIAHGPAIHKWRPMRDALGRVTRPVRVLLTADPEEPDAAGLPEGVDFRIALPRGWLKILQMEDQILLKDARQAWRKLRIVGFGADHALAECRQSAYLVPELKLRLRRRHKSGKHWRILDDARLGDLPPTAQTILVKPGERLWLTGNQEPGRPALRDEFGDILEPARVSCTIPEVFADLEVDQQIWFDDGKIGGRIVMVTRECVEVEINHARPEGSKLGADKGINLPDSQLRLPSLTPKDIEDLRFVVRHADLVGYSFVRTPQDVTLLQEHLHNLDGDQLGIVLKIETRQAFEQLPHLLLSAMRSQRAGVMIARGDLAIECGYERMVELQEEILWFCEAAHVPVIWATQVLEHLTKEGVQSRAEVTDAAMGQRAECVMLNKGPYVVKAVQTLDNILKRMAEHQNKKRSMLRPLKLAGRFAE